VISTIILFLLLALSIAADVVAPHDPIRQFRALRLAPPGTLAPDGIPLLLGADELGRDAWSRVVFGARTSLTVSISAVSLSTMVGLVLGLLSGYFGGWTDLVIQRVMDSQLSIPTLILALLLVALLGPSLLTVIVAISLTQVPRVNRVIRGGVLAAKQKHYVEAARASGCRTPQILLVPSCRMCSDRRSWLPPPAWVRQSWSKARLRSWAWGRPLRLRHGAA
jgi:ABC-type dipeptide/oligopeptide/nickel transport system permease subunit